MAKGRRPARMVASPLELAMTERVRRTLQNTNVSQSQLARQIGTILGEHWDQPRVWKFLWNEVPATIRIWEACAQAINISLQDLVGQPRLNTGKTVAVLTAEENAALMRFRVDPLYRAVSVQFIEMAELSRRNTTVWADDVIIDTSALGTPIPEPSQEHVMPARVTPAKTKTA